MGATADQTIMVTLGVLLAIAGGLTLLTLAALLVKGVITRQRLNKFLAVGIAALVCGTLLTIHYSRPEQVSALEKNLNRQAAELNSRLPKMLDENTRFDEVIVEGKIITYRHTVVNHASNQLNLNTFQSIMHEKLTKEQGPKEEIIGMLENGIEYQYLYFGNDGGLVSAVRISPVTCGLR